MSIIGFAGKVFSSVKTPKRELTEYQVAISLFGGNIVDPLQYPHTDAGFWQFMMDTGVAYTDAQEWLTPRNRLVAQEIGLASLLPPQEWWERSAALGCMFTRMREHLNSPIYIYNTYRPLAYNSHADVGGARRSDHLSNDAIDCDFGSMQRRRQAEAWLRTHYSNPDLEMSLGLGGEKIHIGILSPRGSRVWYYGSYPSSEKQPW